MTRNTLIRRLYTTVVGLQTQKEQDIIQLRTNGGSWASTPTRHGSPANKWSQGNPFSKTSNKPATMATTTATTQATPPAIGNSRKMKQIPVRIKDKKEKDIVIEITSEKILEGFSNT